MIYSGLDDIGKAKSIAGKVIQEVCFVPVSWESRTKLMNYCVTESYK